MPFFVNPQNNSTEYSTGEVETRALTADRTVTSSTAVIAVPELTVNLARFQRLFFRFNLFYSSPTAAGFRYRLTVPGGLTLYTAVRESFAPDATNWVLARDTSNNGTTDITLTHASGTEGVVRGTGIIHNGSTAGDFQVQFAQNVSNAGNTILRAGSTIDFEII